MSRATLTKTIFAGARELGLDEDGRRALQLAATGHASLTTMSEAQLRMVLERMKKAGFTASSSKRRHKPAPRADLRLVHVFWRLLAEAGVVQGGRPSLNAFVRSRFSDAWGAVPVDVDAVRDAAQIAAIAQALKEMGRRAGVDMERKRP